MTAAVMPRTPAELGDQCRVLLSRLRQGSQPLCTLGVASCNRREGASTIATHLALTAAEQSSLSVLLVDANLNHPVQHTTFARPLSPGLAEFLLSRSSTEFEGASTLEDFLQPTGSPTLRLLPVGASVGRYRAAIESADLSLLVEPLKSDTNKLVVFDLPALTTGSFTPRLAGILDGFVLVVQAADVSWTSVCQQRDVLVASGARLLGVVLNQHHSQTPPWMERFVDG